MEDIKVKLTRAMFTVFYKNFAHQKKIPRKTQSPK